MKPSNRFSVILLFCFGVTSIIWLVCDFVPSSSNVLQFKRNKNFTILFYTVPKYLSNVKPKRFLSNCDLDNCEIILNRALLPKSDAVIFYQTMMNFKPPQKIENQTWIYITFESPYHTSEPSTDFKIDWTMSHRNDSDVLSPYGVLKKRLMIPNKNYSSIFHNKKKDVAWVVSNCNTPSKRKEYVKVLQKFINVDIYGSCGTLSCKESRVECKRKLSQDYKFYLSFENSLCKDYMTEKIYSIFSDDINYVPVVRGAPNSKDLLPTNTFIHTLDFKSPKELAKYLLSFGKNESLYVSYLKEKDKYYYYANPFEETGMCNICRRLNEGYKSKGIIDIKKWLWTGRCQSPSDY